MGVTASFILATAQSGPLISGVAASSVTASGAVVSWTTDQAADSQVEYGLTGAYGNTTSIDSSLATSHSETISGLQANTVYNYRVDSRNGAGILAQSGNISFTTAPANQNNNNGNNTATTTITGNVARVEDFNTDPTIDIGDGVHDARPAIQAALDWAAGRPQATIIFRKDATYLISSYSPKETDTTQLELSNWGSPISITLESDDPSMNPADMPTIVSSVNGSYLLVLNGAIQNSSIEGLKFKSSHGLTPNTTSAIEFQSGGAPNGINNWRISHDSFVDFSRAVSFTGAVGMTIDSNSFIMENGRDSGSTDTANPTVGVWSFQQDGNPSINVNTYTQNVTVTNNTYDGCSQVSSIDSLVTKYCGDGFFFGGALNLNVSNNQVKNFSFEGIYLHQFIYPSSVGENTHSTVSNNTVASGIGNSYWGIRADLDGTTVSGNQISGVRSGISLYGTQYPGQDKDVVNMSVVNNTITTSNSDTVASAVGLSVVGVSSSVFTGNTISLGSPSSAWDSYCVYVSGADNRMSHDLDIENNTCSAESPTSGGVSFGLGTQYLVPASFTFKNNVLSNTIYGLKTINLASWGDQSFIDAMQASSTWSYSNSSFSQQTRANQPYEFASVPMGGLDSLTAAVMDSLDFLQRLFMR